MNGEVIDANMNRVIHGRTESFDKDAGIAERDYLVESQLLNRVDKS